MREKKRERKKINSGDFSESKKKVIRLYSENKKGSRIEKSGDI